MGWPLQAIHFLLRLGLPEPHGVSCPVPAMVGCAAENRLAAVATYKSSQWCQRDIADQWGRGQRLQCRSRPQLLCRPIFQLLCRPRPQHRQDTPRSHRQNSSRRTPPIPTARAQLLLVVDSTPADSRLALGDALPAATVFRSFFSFFRFLFAPLCHVHFVLLSQLLFALHVIPPCGWARPRATVWKGPGSGLRCSARGALS